MEADGTLTTEEEEREEPGLSREPTIGYYTYDQQDDAVDYNAQSEADPDLFLSEEENLMESKRIAEAEAALFEPRSVEYFLYLRQKGIPEVKIKELQDAQYRAEEERERLAQLESEAVHTLVLISDLSKKETEKSQFGPKKPRG